MNSKRPYTPVRDAWFWLGINLLGACWLGSGCSEPGSSSGADGALDSGNKASARQPLPIKTVSGVDMVFIPGGSFEMGTEKGEEDEAPIHSVTVSPFAMDTYEVYHELFVKAELPNPSHWQDDPRKPVEQLRWRDAKQYCNERSLMEGLEPCYDEAKEGWPCDFERSGYRLPTEAEWEFAARAGSSHLYPSGSVSKLKQYAWFSDNASQKTYPVGVKKPNGWGLHDMFGNVSEWCQDVYAADAYESRLEVTNPVGPGENREDRRRVMRGGSWKSSASMCRVTFRQGQQTGDTDACFYTDYCGFRCVRRLTLEEARALASSTSE